MPHDNMRRQGELSIPRTGRRIAARLYLGGRGLPRFGRVRRCVCLFRMICLTARATQRAALHAARDAATILRRGVGAIFGLRGSCVYRVIYWARESDYLGSCLISAQFLEVVLIWRTESTPEGSTQIGKGGGRSPNLVASDWL